MFLFSKEKKVSELLTSHVSIVENCLQLTYHTVDFYFKDRLNEAKKSAIEVDGEERHADKIRRQITDLLYSGAFLPNLRQDIHALVSQLDDVANAAESTCDFLLGERPDIPQEFIEEILLVYQKTLDQFKHVTQAIQRLVEKSGSDIDKIRDHNRQVGIIESEIDEIEWHLTRKIFHSNLDLANKIHLRTWLRLSTQLSDQTENLSDSLNLLVLKAKI